MVMNRGTRCRCDKWRDYHVAGLSHQREDRYQADEGQALRLPANHLESCPIVGIGIGASCGLIMLSSPAHETLRIFLGDACLPPTHRNSPPSSGCRRLCVLSRLPGSEKVSELFGTGWHRECALPTYQLCIGNCAQPDLCPCQR